MKKYGFLTEKIPQFQYYNYDGLIFFKDSPYRNSTYSWNTKPHILIFDPDKTYFQQLRKSCKKQGIAVFSCNNFGRLYRSVLSDQFDLLLINDQCLAKLTEDEISIFEGKIPIVNISDYSSEKTPPDYSVGSVSKKSSISEVIHLLCEILHSRYGKVV